MGKTINIEHTFIKTPTHIIVEGKEYPITRWNISVVNEYWETNDESVLDNLKDFALVF